MSGSSGCSVYVGKFETIPITFFDFDFLFDIFASEKGKDFPGKSEIL
jgi:hypothetical protein